MPTINYYYADVYPDQLEMPDFSVEISMEEWNRRIEQEHRWESDGRMARREVSLFDMIHAEILGERNAEKAKVRRQRSDARKHKELPKERKHREKMRKDRLYGYYYGECIKVAGNPDSLPINHRRDAEAERILRADFVAEMEDHENAIALYNDFVGMAMFSEHMAEIDMGLEQEKFPVKNMVEGDMRDARECRKMAQEILKGECY